MALPRLPWLVKAFFVADLLVGSAYVVNLLIGRPFAKISLFLDLDGEANLPAWYSSMQWAAAAGLMAFAAYRLWSRRAKSAVPLFVVAGVFLFLSLDESARIHERLFEGLAGKTGRGRGPLGGLSLWLPALGFPFVILVGLAVHRARVAFDDAPGALRTLVIGLVIFSIGAFVMEPVAGLLLKSSGPASVWVEETMEMIGVTFLLWSAFILARHEGLLAFARDTAIAPHDQP